MQNRFYLMTVLIILCCLAALCACHKDGSDVADETVAIEDDFSEVRDALDKSVEYLLIAQDESGYWEGKFITDTSVTAYYVILMQYLEQVDESRQQKALNYILGNQQDDGSWNGYPGGPGVLDITVLDYLACKLAGMPADDPVMANARQWILSSGGAELVSELPNMTLALFGQRPWNAFPPVNTTAMIAEDALYMIGYHHAMLIPILVIAESYHRVIPAEGRGVAEIFINDPWEGVHERAPRKGCCTLRAVDWILERQEGDGNWSGVFNNTMYSLMALKSLDDPAYSEVIARGIAGVEAFQNIDGDSLNQQFSTSPVQDTGYVIDVLRTAGMPSNDPAVEKAVEWLMSKQTTTYGDWHHMNPDGAPGGWSFEHYNEWFPDVDCTAIVLRGLSSLSDDHLDGIWDGVQKGMDWVITMQNSDGGWAAWDKNVLDLQALLPFYESPWLMSDTSTADLSGRVLTALSSMGYPGEFGDPSALPRAIEFIKSKQETFGAWWGRWGINYVYGTGEVLKGLILAGEDPDQHYIKVAVKWLKSAQNADGGWGETPRSYLDPDYAGVGDSTAALTAYALTALMSADGPDSPEVEKGIQYLLDTQTEDGSWFDEDFLGTNIPEVWYARYDMASIYKPAHTLGQFLRLVER